MLQSMVLAFEKKEIWSVSHRSLKKVGPILQSHFHSYAILDVVVGGGGTQKRPETDPSHQSHHDRVRHR